MENQLPIVEDGTLDYCPHQACDFTCCEFGAGNFIAMYPGELEKAQSTGQSVGHLFITSDGNGGQRAICQAKDKANCDSGYKPLDCASYPLFPTVNSNEGIEAALKGSKCPLQSAELELHREWVVSSWAHVGRSVPNLLNWIRSVRLVGYEHVADFEV